MRDLLNSLILVIINNGSLYEYITFYTLNRYSLYLVYTKQLHWQTVVLEAFTLLLDAFCYCCFSVTNSCLTLCDPIERLLLNHQRRQDSWPPEEKNSILGQRRGLITQSFCIIKFYLSIKDIEKAFDIGIRRGQKEYALLVFSWKLYSHQQSVNERKECLKTQNGTRPLTHKMHFGIILAPNGLSWAIK